ncbi:hypothetical protein MalM25_22380 [Planctomycetes bacterium MalM25]|nr:hypothetical protein MalM25_22380 [Planctomycetes bacterium MalM25]
MLPRLLLALLAALPLSGAALGDDNLAPPPVAREFRAAWIATVANIDWPSRPGLPVKKMQEELAALLDECVRLRLNAVVLQVRPACDAMYASELEPWSEYLTGKQGQAPPDGFDPLTWACEQAHARGLELHAWFNPYRAVHPSAKSPLDDQHIAVRRPELAPKYGKHRWLDPGAAEAAEHSIAVVLDVVRRYDIDAVHFDDYFYPYPVTDALGDSGDGPKQVEVPFPDDASWRVYCDATPEADRLSRDDWRRDNVNRFVRDLSEAIHREKPHVRLGISPFGIWRPGTPEGIQGFDQYAKLYADARLWLHEGWVDYFTPQLYWAIDQKPQSFTTLLSWWATQNPTGKHLWPGLYTSKVGGEKPGYPPQEIIDQIVTAREQIGATGHVHFSMKALSNNWAGLADRLRDEVYTQAALPPATDWLAGDTPAPASPQVERLGETSPPEFKVASPDGRATRWVLQKRCGEEWTTGLIGAQIESLRIRPNAQGERANAIAVYAVDGLGRASEPTVLAIEAQDD